MPQDQACATAGFGSFAEFAQGMMLGERPIRSGSGLEMLLAAVLDELAVAIFIVEPSGRLLHLNRAGERLIRRGTALRVANRGLAAYTDDAQSLLGEALSALADPRAPRCRGVALADGTEAGLVAAVVRLDDGPTSRTSTGCFGDPAPLGAVFVLDPGAPRTSFNTAFGALHGLTGCELRVTQALAHGATKNEISDAIGIAPSTVSTHLARAFAKTGTSRQADLIRLFLTSMPPLNSASRHGHDK